MKIAVHNPPPPRKVRLGLGLGLTNVRRRSSGLWAPTSIGDGLVAWYAAHLLGLADDADVETVSDGSGNNRTLTAVLSHAGAAEAQAGMLGNYGL